MEAGVPWRGHRTLQLFVVPLQVVGVEGGELGVGGSGGDGGVGVRREGKDWVSS